MIYGHHWPGQISHLGQNGEDCGRGLAQAEQDRLGLKGGDDIAQYIMHQDVNIDSLTKTKANYRL